MRQLTAFIKKEFMEVCRNSKLMICGILFFILGIMNPAIAKLTPWMMEMLSETLESSGMEIKEVEVTALMSWQQFYKNIPIGIVLFVLMFCGIVALEYQKGTLINMVTKGMSRWKILVSKGFVLLVLWSVFYFLNYGITYFYNDYYWNNAIADHLFFSAFCMYLLGIWLISLIILMSSFINNGSGVALGTGAVFILCNFLGMIPEMADFLPTKLMGGSELIYGNGVPGDYQTAIGISLLWSIGNVILGIVLFNKKEL